MCGTTPTIVCEAGGNQQQQQQQQQQQPARNKEPILMRSELSERVELRPGRTLFVRKIRIGTQTDQQEKDQQRPLQVVFVHGLCATERQFTPLLEALHEQLVGSCSSTTTATKTTTLDCLLYDWMGCGQSWPILRTWEAYENKEGIQDLQALIEKYLDWNRPWIIVGHSYAPNWILQLLVTLRQKQQTHSQLNNQLSPSFHFLPRACILLGTAIRTPSLSIPDGGIWLMRALPLSILNCLQNLLSAAFVKTAIHSDFHQLQQDVLAGSNTNDMQMAQAYHCHMQWLTPREARVALGYIYKGDDYDADDNMDATSSTNSTIMDDSRSSSCSSYSTTQNNNNQKETASTTTPIPTLILHGVHDGVISIQAAQEMANLYKPHCRFVALDRSSHLLMLEHPAQVAQEILRFVVEN